VPRAFCPFAIALHVTKVLNAAVLVKDVRDIDPKKGRRLGAATGGLTGGVGGPGGEEDDTGH
jgi:hypothetical protein